MGLDKRTIKIIVVVAVVVLVIGELVLIDLFVSIFRLFSRF